MRWRGLLASLLPAAGLAFAPALPISSPGSSVAVRGCHISSTHYLSFNTWNFHDAQFGSSTLGSALDRSRGRIASRSARFSLRMGAPLVEEPVTAEEARELIGKARAIVEADMGVKARDMLADDFRFLWQFNGDLSRAEYLMEGKGPYTTLRTALPDLFWNAYDFRVDKYQSNRVWATTRLSGTHNGPLVFEGKEYPATGKRVEAAPECVSLVFDKSSGLCTKLTGGFCIDRGAGNTGPAGGIWGVLQAIGEPVSAWKYFPPAKVLADVFGPTFRPKKSTGAAKAPFRDGVAIALAKQTLTAFADDLDSLDSLLADDAQFYAPILGPLKKKEFVKSALDLNGFFSGLDTTANYYDARVDPLEPSRVWITTRRTNKVVGPIKAFGFKFEPKRDAWQSGPECFSITFDQDGYASKITLGCPMDTDLGDTNGLCNFLGILEGMGIPAPDFLSRPVPVSFRRLVDAVTPAGMKKSKQLPAKAKPTPKASPTAKTTPPSKAAPTTKPSKPTLALPSMTAGMESPPTSTAKTPKNVSPPPAVAKLTPKPMAAPTPVAAAKKSAAPPAKRPPPPLAKTPVAAAPKAPAATPAMMASKSKAAPASMTKKSTATAKSTTRAVGPSSSPFGGLFDFGGGSGGSLKAASGAKDAGSVGIKAPASAIKATSKKASPAPASKSTPAPAKKTTRALPPPTPPTKSSGVTLSPALTAKLESIVGSGQGLKQLTMRTNLYARGGISAMDYWGTLKKTLGPDGLQNVGPDIIGALPTGNQKSALFKIFSTE